jgi:hypothetical protein
MRILAVCFFLLISSRVFPCKDASNIGALQVKSQELNYINGQPGFQLELTIQEDLFIISEPVYTLPANWSAFSYTKIKGIRCVKGQYFGIYVVIKHPTQNLPLLPQELNIQLSLASAKDTSIKQTVSTKIYFHFTNYNTIEIWNPYDYSNLYRVWNTNEIPRTFIAKSSIPKSDIPANYEVKEDWQDDFTLKRVEGLPYAIPMLAKHPDSIALYNNDDLPVGEDPDSLYEDNSTSTTNFRAARLRIKLQRTFTGQVSGRLVTTITNDLGQRVTIPLAGVNVLLKEYDWYANETFGETHTDENGYFYFSYSKKQSFGEGREVTLFLKYKTKNGEYDIKVKEHKILGGAYEEHTWLGDYGQNVTINTGNINLSNDAFKPLHWAYKSFVFCSRNGVPLTKSLAILPFEKSSRFQADGFYTPIENPFMNPTIYLEGSDCTHENTIYHEFGHFMMWNVQKGNYMLVIPKSKSGEHSWSEENTSRLAFSEGWADAFQMIVDGYYYREDQEFGYDQAIREPRYEIRRKYGNINNGFNSEYYIATALYDLWDGANKGLPASLPGTSLHGYNDKLSNGWSTDDNIQMSFQEIVKPLQLRADNPITAIDLYYQILLQQVPSTNCTLRSDIARCFKENKVVYDIILDNYGISTSLSSDLFGNSVEVEITGELPIVGQVKYKDSYFINTPGGYNAPITSSTYPYITELLTIKKHPVTSTGRPVSVSLNGSAFSGALTNGQVATCNGADIEVERALLTIGGSGLSATLTLNENSYLKAQYLSTEVTLNNQSSIVVNNGGLMEIGPEVILNLNNSSKIIVKSGGTLYIRAYATVNFTANVSIEVESGGYLCIDNNANLNYINSSAIRLANGVIFNTSSLWYSSGSQNCKNNFDCLMPLVINPEALRFNGVNQFCTIEKRNNTLDLGTGEFTIEAYIKSYVLTPSTAQQVILSSRHPNLYGGFMFGLWSDGRLWCQLNGTPNLGYDRGPSLLDGNCHHVAITRSASNIVSFYVDGVLTYQELTGQRNINSFYSLLIGKDAISGLPFNGEIGEIRIWNIEKTAAQILAGMNQNVLPGPNLMACWDFKSYTQDVIDISGNNNQGFLGSTASCEVVDPVVIDQTAVACNSIYNFREVSIDESTNGTTSVAYPNPFQSYVNIMIPQHYGLTQLLILDELGNEVTVKKDLRGGELYIIGNELSPGLYLFVLESDQYREQLKVVKVQ